MHLPNCYLLKKASEEHSGRNAAITGGSTGLGALVGMRVGGRQAAPYAESAAQNMKAGDDAFKYVEEVLLKPYNEARMRGSYDAGRGVRDSIAATSDYKHYRGTAEKLWEEGSKLAEHAKNLKFRGLAVGGAGGLLTGLLASSIANRYNKQP